MKMDELENRAVYKLRSRNLKLGVWDEKNKGFIGIRTKFGYRYLSTEYHWDCESFATAQPICKIADVSKDIPLMESLPTICKNCEVLVEFIREPDRSCWLHVGDKTCNDVDPVRPRNQKLFDFLEKLEGG